MKKIGILTFHRTHNYGAVLQAYALAKALSAHQVEYIDYVHPRSRMAQVHCNHKLYDTKNSVMLNAKHFVRHYLLRRHLKKEKKIQYFIKHYVPISKNQYICAAELEVIQNQYDVLISGSDQIWNPDLTGKEMDPNYWLAFGNDQIKRMSYASSAGSYTFNETEKTKIKRYLSGFHAISVREASLQRELSDLTSKSIEVVGDPTFLLEKSAWDEIATPSLAYEYLLLYNFGNCNTCLYAAQSIADQLGVKLLSLGRKVPHGTTLSNCGIQDFLGLFKNARFVITNSFHGTIFSLIFNRNFFSVWYNDNPYRALDLLERVNIRERIIKAKSEILNVPLELEFDEVNKKVDEIRMQGLSFLTAAIEG
jgi:hypothetical protein